VLPPKGSNPEINIFKFDPPPMVFVYAIIT
jgi:hypothetical protein